MTEGIVHWCPGCDEVHGFTIKRISGEGPTWSFDGNIEAPTCSPSIRLFDQGGTRCHYFIRAGQIEFCADSPHALAGKTVPLPEWPYAPGAYGGIEEPTN